MQYIHKNLVEKIKGKICRPRYRWESNYKRFFVKLLN